MLYSWYFQKCDSLATTDITNNLTFCAQFQLSQIHEMADIMPDSRIILMIIIFFVQNIFF